MALPPRKKTAVIRLLLILVPVAAAVVLANARTGTGYLSPKPIGRACDGGHQPLRSAKDATGDGDTVLFQGELSALKASVEALRRTVIALQADAVDHPRPGDGQEMQEMAAAPTPDHGHEKTNAMMEVAEMRFRQQTVDKAWSSAAKDLVMAALARSGGSPATQAVTGIDCRAGMCRVEIVADANQKATNAQKLPVSVGTAMPYLVSATEYTDGGNTKSSVLFISEDPIGDQ